MTIQIVRRWAMVMAGVALLCGLPVIASALPVAQLAGHGAAAHDRTSELQSL